MTEITEKLRHRNTDLREMKRILKNLRHRQHDMIVPANRIRMTETGHFVIDEAPIPEQLAEQMEEEITTEGSADLPYQMLKLAHRHLTNKLPIPAFKRAYDFMRSDEPELLSDVVNTYLQKSDKRWLVRTLRPIEEDGSRGIIRAVLSDRYQMIDNYDVFLAAAQAVRRMIEDDESGLSSLPDIRCSLSPRNMYVEFTFPEIPTSAPDLVEGYRDPNGTRDWTDKVSPGFVIRNSEVGDGAFEIRPRARIEVCGNGMTRKQDALRKIHVGQQMEVGSFRFSEEVREETMALAQKKVKEAAEYFASPEYVDDLVEDMMDEEATEDLEHPREAVRNARDVLDIPEDEEDELMGFFERGHSKRKVDVTHAVTAYANSLEDPDEAYRLEAQAPSLVSQMDQLDVTEEQVN